MASTSTGIYRQHFVTYRQIDFAVFPWLVTVYSGGMASPSIGSAWANSEADAVALGKRIVDQELDEYLAIKR